MSDLQNSVRFTWQLVSQFVSWEFCRYMCEQKQDGTSETDVLTFLRNMIVQRTEKSMSEITKHEIVAKFIMEAKEVQNFSRMSCIIPLSESVKKIFPELEPALSKLMHYLETFLNVLESTDESRKELIHIRIQDAINDFIIEANRLLPQPHLLKVVDQHRQMCPKPVKKVIYNAMLFEKVLECLVRYESITPAEAKLIAVSLSEDKIFEKILLNAEAEPETEADSEHIFSQEFEKNSQNCNEKEILPHLQLPNDEFLSVPHQAVPEEIVNVPVVSEEQPSHISPSLSPPILSPSVCPLSIRKISKCNKTADLINNESYNHMQFAQSSANESQSDDCSLIKETTVSRKFKQIYNNQRTHKTSDSDTSDCDKNPDYRFLTPTLFKKKKGKKPSPPKSKVVYLSDSDSNDSSIITTIVSSQQNDPNWSVREAIFTQSQKTKSQKTQMKTKKKTQKKTDPLLDSYSSDDNNIFDYLAATTSTSSHQPSTTAVHTDSEDEIPTKRRRIEKNVKLFKSPNISIQDFVSRIKRPNPITSNEVPVHSSTNTRRLRNRPAGESGKSSNNRQKCKQCSKTFKTAIALRRHVFLKHTELVPDSDCDS